MITPDALTEILQTVHLESTVLCHCELTAPWGIYIDGDEAAVFHIVTKGCCFLKVDNQPTTISLSTGDFVVISPNLGHVISDNPNSPVINLEKLLFDYQSNSHKPLPNGHKTLRHGGGGTLTKMLSGCFWFRDYPKNPLLTALPPLIHIKGEEGRAVPWLEMTLQFIACEIETDKPASLAVMTRLADVLFVQAIRAYLDGLEGERSSWLQALTDSSMRKALDLIHHHPEENWTVASLAKQVAMSRSAFAARFTQLVGQPPLQYLTAWRMQKAAQLLRDDQGTNIKEIAKRVGYDSEIAFSRAFKRWADVAPGAFRRGGCW